jgi:hypothetical protein
MPCVGFDLGFRASEDSTCLRRLGYRDRRHYAYYFFIIDVISRMSCEHLRWTWIYCHFMSYWDLIYSHKVWKPLNCAAETKKWLMQFIFRYFVRWRLTLIHLEEKVYCMKTKHEHSYKFLVNILLCVKICHHEENIKLFGFSKKLDFVILKIWLQIKSYVSWDVMSCSLLSTDVSEEHVVSSSGSKTKRNEKPEWKRELAELYSFLDMLILRP